MNHYHIFLNYLNQIAGRYFFFHFLLYPITGDPSVNPLGFIPKHVLNPVTYTLLPCCNTGIRHQYLMLDDHNDLPSSLFSSTFVCPPLTIHLHTILAKHFKCKADQIALLVKLSRTTFSSHLEWNPNSSFSGKSED